MASSSDSYHKVVVVGAGVVGLTTAIRLREDGHQVVVLTKESPSTFFSRENSPLKGVKPSPYSSPASVGIWAPTGLMDERTREWASKTFQRFKKEAEEGIGVEMIEGYALSRNENISELPWFSKLTPVTIETPTSDANVPVTHRSGFKYDAPVVHVEDYMMYLEQKVREMEVKVELMLENSEQNGDWDLERLYAFAKSKFGDRVTIVNCCGLGAEKITGEKMIPGRGISVKVSKPLGVNHFVLEEREHSTISNVTQKVQEGVYLTCVPRGTEYVLGSSLIMGSRREDTDSGEVERLVEKCAEILPSLEQAKVQSVRVGLRPFTEDYTVRLGKCSKGDSLARGIEMISNYGHGGLGLTLCWGCADEVSQIIGERLPRDLDTVSDGTAVVLRGP